MKPQENRPVRKMAVGIVDNHGSFLKPFAFSLANVCASFARWADSQAQDWSLDVYAADMGGIDDMRNTVAAEAAAGGAEYIFWMDSDMSFPADSIQRLLQYCERDGYEAASGLYTHKAPPFMPHIYGREGKKGHFRVPSKFPLDRPFEVAAAGFGCLLMRTSVFKRVKKPWFTMEYADGRMKKGEDLPFCSAAKMRMVLDPTVSCGHYRVARFGVEEFLSYNGIAVEDGRVSPTKEQAKKVMSEAGRLFRSSR